MRRIFTSLFIILLFAASAKAQTSGGPDAYGYTWRTNADPQGPIFNWIDIENFPEVVDVTPYFVDDNMTPFSYVMHVPFHFYWYDVKSFYVGANGFIAFSNGQGVSQPFPAIPLSSGQNNYIAAMGSDLIFKAGTPVAPIPGAMCKFWESPLQDTLIIMWKNVPFFDANSPGYVGSNSFEIILTSADSSITFQYQNQVGTYTTFTNFLTAGIENNSGNIGLQYIYDTYPVPGTAVKYYYPSNSTLLINDASTSYTGTLGTKGIILSRNGAPYTSYAEVKNTGNTTLNPFNTWSRILNSVNGVQVRDTVTTTTLAAGQSQLIAYPDKWTPTAAGTFRQLNNTLLGGDATPSNDQGILEIQVVDTTKPHITLAFDNSSNSGAGLSWNGGQGGAAMHFIPPFYPCNIDSMGCFIVSDILNVGYSMQIYADDGPNGQPGTRLDSVFMPAGTFTQGQYNQTAASAPITINSGGFYVAWMMGGNSVLLGEDANAPYSHRSYEITGPAYDPASWTSYRNGEFNDFIIHAVISTIPVGINEPASPLQSIGDFYPNPAVYKTSLTYTLNERATVNVTVYDLSGKAVAVKNLGTREAGNDFLELNVQNLSAGVYNCRIEAGGYTVNKKIVVLR